MRDEGWKDGWRAPGLEALKPRPTSSARRFSRTSPRRLASRWQARSRSTATRLADRMVEGTPWKLTLLGLRSLECGTKLHRPQKLLCAPQEDAVLEQSSLAEVMLCQKNRGVSPWYLMALLSAQRGPEHAVPHFGGREPPVKRTRTSRIARAGGRSGAAGAAPSTTGGFGWWWWPPRQEAQVPGPAGGLGRLPVGQRVC